MGKRDMTDMLYTVGDKESYSRYREEQGDKLWKLGRRDDYPGGSVYLTYDAALAASEKHHNLTVYGLATEVSNTYADEAGNLHLIASCPIIDLPDDGPCPDCDDSGWKEFYSGGIWTGENISVRQEPCTCACGDDVRRELVK